MSAFTRRQRINPYAKDRTIRAKNDPHRNTNHNVGCYAIAHNSAPVSGIYFSHKEATQRILLGRPEDNTTFRKFNKVKDAENFLRELGFVPKIESGGWVSARNRDPILYSRYNSISSNNCAPINGERDLTKHKYVTPANSVNQTMPKPPMERSGRENIRQRWSQHEHQRDRIYLDNCNIPSSHEVITIDSSPESRSPGVSRIEVPPGKPMIRKKRSRDVIEAQSFDNNIPRSPESRSPGVPKCARGIIEVQSSDTDEHHFSNKRVDHIQREENEASAASKQESAPKFDAVQKRAIDAALVGKNVFLTGVAGTGKSLVTKKIVEDAKNMKKEVAVAAPTGVAAVNLGPELGAQTVHSLAGVGVPQTASDFEKMLSSWTAKKWRKIEVLVLDEIGMLGADFLDWMDVYVRKARKKPLEPFGGIQLIFVGDFAQLGPIPGKGHSLRNKAFEPDQPGADCLLNIHECAAYAFQTVLWREADFHHVHLRKVYRQKNRDFQLALMDIREAKADSDRVKALVETCSNPLTDRQELKIPDGIKPTILYCTNRNVDNENFHNLAKLSDRGKVFEAADSTSISGNVSPAGRDVVERMLKQNSFFKDCSASKKIHLKVGAQVMLLHNLDLNQGLVNGSRGVVEKFALCPVVKDIINGEEMLIGPNDANKFPGCRFEDLKFNQKTEFDGKIWRICRFDRYPLVRFMNNVSRIIVQETFERVLYLQGKCMRKQIPLRLAWALTIHKSQGATLDYVVCDLQGCFTSGQAYVALSRARSMLGLEIKNFSSRHVTADPLVEAFYDALDRHEMKTFLEEKAGLWWFPILKSPSWLRMFQYATGKHATVNSQQFRSWVADYKPIEDYHGWGA